MFKKKKKKPNGHGESQHCISDTEDLYACEQENVKGRESCLLE